MYILYNVYHCLSNTFVSIRFPVLSCSYFSKSIRKPIFFWFWSSSPSYHNIQVIKLYDISFFFFLKVGSHIVVLK